MCRVISYKKGSCVGYARSDCQAMFFKLEGKMFYQGLNAFEVN